MKKMIYLVLAFTLIFINVKNTSANKKQISDLILKNIECLATPENSGTHCEGRGSIDCPIYYNKVYIVLYAEI